MYRGGGRGGGRGGDYGGRGRRGGGDGVDGGPDMYTSSASSLAKEIQTSLFLTEQPPEVSVGSGSGSDVAVADHEWAASPAEGTAGISYSSSSLKRNEALVMVHASQPGWGKARKMCDFLGQVAQNTLCLYDVAITPDTKATRTNRAVMGELMEAYKHSFFGGKTPAYDGSKSIYTAGRLPFEAKSFVVKLTDRQSYEEEGKKNKGKKRYENFMVTIRYVGGVDLTVLQQFLFGKMRDLPQETILSLDVILRKFTNPSPIAFLLPSANVDLTVNKMENLSDWAYLPIVEEIPRFIISIGDYIRFRAVCWPWRLNTLLSVQFPPQVPWLMMPYGRRANEGDNGVRLFYDLWQSKMHSIPLPETINQVCCASFSGWLFLVSRISQSHDLDVFLLNPLTRRRVILPPLSSRAKLLGEEQDIDITHYLRDSERSCLVIVSLLTRRSSAPVLFCRVKDPLWTMVQSRAENTRRLLDWTSRSGNIFFLYEDGMINVLNLMSPNPNLGGLKRVSDTSKITIFYGDRYSCLGVDSGHWDDAMLPIRGVYLTDCYSGGYKIYFTKLHNGNDKSHYKYHLVARDLPEPHGLNCAKWFQPTYELA